MSPIPINITGTLCELCHEFISNLFAIDFTRQETYPARWQPIGTEWTPGTPWRDVFHHHETFSDLSKGAEKCELCYVLHADLASMDPTLHQGWLGLYPFWSSGRTGDNKEKGYFRAGFRESLDRMPWGSMKIGSVPLHSFRVCRRGPLKEGEEIHWLDAYKKFPAVSPTLHSPDISRMVAMWQQECLDTHKNCPKGKPESELPTRVLDLGESEAAPIRLYEPPDGKKAAYASLSHCWGGKINSITTEANKATRRDAMDFDDLPQNFKDAIHVTRALGIRYLWIDALCIIQDSKEDWFREAAKMQSVYAGASVVISALDAAGSTAGFLKPNRVPLAILNDEYAVQKVFRELNDYLIECPLVRRGWCMQERLLANPILHIGAEQMFWECHTEFKCEDGRKYTGDSDGHVMAEFLTIRKRIGVSAARRAELDFRSWYQLLEEYSMRDFTVSSDKLPALAGAAALFKSTKPAATYVAGLWKEDVARGLLWCAHYDHMPGRKVWGISFSDRISVLAKPPEKRAPSWSWAALDGQIDFWALRTYGFVVETLDVVMSAGENELTAAFPTGTVKLRGEVARMFYHPPDDGLDVGILTFEEADSPSDRSVALSGCVMDLDRRTSRFCWVVVMSKSNGSWYLLVLDRCADGSYQRIGMSTAHNVEVNPGRFETQDIQII
ncbi:HET-domain-containing protein [Hypoxylon rubiginosum]|uniref:HET-domain-containing protein n=1 Tax=Hypoxylon rubiginosum TaxID=110542 RepID=A0ACB9YYW1_9PEZI|nr:HET-domain-containing protein [Hypoxylon rubiginosum]